MFDMAQIKAFRGIHYNLNRVNLEDVTTPPYDVVSPVRQDEYYRKSQFNIIRLDLGKTYPNDHDGDNRYTRAESDFRAWLNSGTLIQDAEPAVYIYRQTYAVRKKMKTVTGLICLVKLEELGKGVLPHEKTLSGPKQDRRNLLEACRANFSQVFALYSDKSGTVKTTLNAAAAGAPAQRTTDESGVVHEVWNLSDAAPIQTIAAIIDKERLLIADGHHRYETSLNFAKDTGAIGIEEEPAGHIMMYLVDMAGEDLTILPTHRLVKLDSFNLDSLLDKISQAYEVTPVTGPSDVETESPDPGQVVLGIYANGRCWRLRGDRNRLADQIDDEQSADWRRLDTALLQETLLGPYLGVNSGDQRLSFTQDSKVAVERVDRGEADLAIFVAPVQIAQIAAVAATGEKMPQKSTYFYPKPRTGLIIYDLLTSS